ncbi:MAG: GrpB family protein [Anaerolineaceae bacterium]|nr:GrpB family protein [Anaerolineaceae bacterium]
MADNSQKFSGRAASYAKARPGYAPALLTWLKESYCLEPGKTVADLGSGTGILTLELLRTGATIYAVEPNAEMRSIAEQNLSGFPHFISVHSSAEASSLPEHAFDLICAAEAFHWFDSTRFAKEAHRILKFDGQVALIWNMKDESTPFVQDYAALLNQFCPNFKGFGGGILARLDEIRLFFEGEPEVHRFDHPITKNLNNFLTGVASSSYALLQGDPQFNEFHHALKALFARYAQNGVLNIANQSLCFSGRPRNPYATETIQVCDYNAAWPQAFEAIRTRLQPVLAAGAIAIEHVGSTSVPNLAAKPIIDIDIVIPSMTMFENICLALSKLGYTYDGNKGVPDRESFSYRNLPDLMKHHLYVCAQDSPELARHLQFRDFLRRHPSERQAYAKLKKQAAAHHPHDIDGYLEEKGVLISEIYRKLGLIH